MPWEEEGGGAVWGEITGTLADQADLNDPLVGFTDTFDILNSAIGDIGVTLDAKQATLVSATNIKTINGGSVLGAGDLVVAGAAAWGSVTGTLGDQTDLQTALDAKQPLDADLTTIAGLTATTNNFIVSAASAWASRTPAQAKTALALVKADVGLSSVDDTTDAGKPVSTAQQTALNLKANSLGADDNYVTDAEKVKLGNLSNTNTGDQTSIVGITGTTAQFNTALSDANFATGGGTATGTNTGDQTTIVGITGTIAQFNTAISDGDLATGGGTATGTNTGDQTLPTDATIATTDVTTNNASTSKHGWMMKYPGGTTNFLREDGTFAAPAGGPGGGASLGLIVATAMGMNLS